jgi:polyisoprenyl-phosphate glycosyltransferase
MRLDEPQTMAFALAQSTGRLVIVTPVYEDNEACARLFRELKNAAGGDAYIVAVDDGSVHTPLDGDLIGAAGLDGVVLRLKRNVGHQRAIAVGLNFVAAHPGAAERIVVMDSDGEDLPTSVAELLRLLETDDIDVAVACRRDRVEGLRFRAFYAVYKALFQLLTGRRIAFGNFMALKPAALVRMAAMQELWVHLAACVLASRLRIAQWPQDRGPRYAGRSQMSFVSLALHGFRALTVFAEDVFVRVGVACAVVAAGSICGVVLAVLLKVLGFATPGWFSIALGILLLVFLQTGTLTLLTLMLVGRARGRIVAADDWEDYVTAALPVRACA